MGTMPVVWVTGPVGVGKTTTAWELHLLLRERSVPSAYVDLDQLGMRFPARADDPQNHRVKAATLAALVPGYLDAGARCVVVSGNCPDQATLDLHRDALPGSDLRVVRLRVAEAELRRRVVERGTFLDMLDELLEEARSLDAAPPEAVVLDVDDVTPREAAALVLAATEVAL